MRSPTEDEIRALLRAAIPDEQAQRTLLNWGPMSSFPLKAALDHCGGGSFKMNHHIGDLQNLQTISASRAIEMVLGSFGCDCEISTGSVNFSSELGFVELLEQDLSMAHYYGVFLVARLWAIRHKPE